MHHVIYVFFGSSLGKELLWASYPWATRKGPSIHWSLNLLIAFYYLCESHLEYSKLQALSTDFFPKCAAYKFVPRISFLMRMILFSIFSPLLPYKKNNNQAKKVYKNYSAITDLFFNVQNLIRELIIKLVLSLKGTVVQIEKSLINDHLLVLKEFWKFCMPTVNNFAVIEPWNLLFFTK